MAKKLIDFGTFGSNRKSIVRAERLRRIRFYLFVFLGALCLPAAYAGWSEFYRYYVEQEEPKIVFLSIPLGVGIEPVTIPIEVTDLFAGLKEITVNSIQGENTKELFRRDYSKEERHKDVFSISFNGKNSGLQEGQLKIEITAKDRSKWANVAKRRIDLRVDFGRPILETISPLPTLEIGDSALLIYRVADINEVFSGLKVGPWLFPGFHLAKLDIGFERFSDLYFGFFTVPLGSAVVESQLKLVARDRVDNVASSNISLNIKAPTLLTRSIKFNGELAKKRVDDLFRSFQERDAIINSRAFDPPGPSQDLKELGRRCRLVNQDYRLLVEEALKQVYARPKPQRYWKGPFISPVAKPPIGSFGEKRKYLFEGEDCAEAINMGLDFLTEGEERVSAANEGIVIFRDHLGPLGLSVIIDHGFGLTTLYSELGKANVSEGDRVLRGDSIGVTGLSGLNLVSGMHYEMRLFGVPIKPSQWWDERWISQNIDDHLKNLKNKLGIVAREPLF